jgi:hypothetical protein
MVFLGFAAKSLKLAHIIKDGKEVNEFSSATKLISQQIDFSISTFSVTNATSILEVVNCPSTEKIFKKFQGLIQKFFIKNSAGICIRFRINSKDVTLSDVQYHNFVHHLKNFKRSFLISFESIADNSFVIYWRMKDKINFYKLKVGQNSEEVWDFTKNILLESLLMDFNGNKFKK